MLISIITACLFASLPASLATPIDTSQATPSRRWDSAPERVIAYEAFYRDQQNKLVPLLPIIQNNSEITHLLLFASDVHPTEPHLTLGGQAPDNTSFHGTLWDEVAQIRDAGVQVYTSLGGYLADSFILLEQDFDTYYPYIKDFLTQYNLSGIDLDIEPAGPGANLTVSGAAPIVKLIKQLRADFGRDFVITLAPVASDLTFNAANFSGFDYFEVEREAVYDDGTSMIDWYNAQFYSGFAPCDTTEVYDDIIQAGWDPARVVFGLLSAQSEGDGYCNISTLKPVFGELRDKYPTFGGFDAYDWSRAGQTEGISKPEWFRTLANVIKGQGQ